jgi:hypothetical protein
VVVSGHHVFRPQVDEGHDVNARDFRDIPLVAIGDAVSKGIHWKDNEQSKERGNG